MKEYNGEKAIISLTSWKKRINSISRTIFSIMTNCPDYHIVIVLSEEEFKNKEKDLPSDLMALVENNCVEILWIYKNYKSFKKVFFTMKKYKTVPIITADDGCVYSCNFADKIYNLWLKNKKCICVNTLYRTDRIDGGNGSNGILYPPNCFGDKGIKVLEKSYDELKKNPNDDRFMGCLAKILNIKYKSTQPLNKLVNVYTNLPDCESVGMTKNKVYKRGSNWKFVSIIKKALKLK